MSLVAECSDCPVALTLSAVTAMKMLEVSAMPVRAVTAMKMLGVSAMPVPRATLQEQETVLRWAAARFEKREARSSYSRMTSEQWERPGHLPSPAR